MIKKIYITILTFSLLFTLTGCKQSKENKEKNHQLILGTNAVYYPYESINSEGEAEGFDIDMAKAIAKKLNKKLSIKETGFDSLILELKQGKIDIIMSGMSITPSRQKEISMLPYQGEVVQSLSLAFWRNIPKGIQSLEDIKKHPFPMVSVQTATFQNDYLDGVEGIQVKSLEGNSELIMDIKYGKSLAALFEPHIASAMKEKFPELQFLNIPLEEEDWVLGNGIGIKKENSLLEEEISTVLEDLKSEGTIKELESKWFKGENVQ